MPLRHQPATLQRATMSVIANNFERLCYNCTSQHRMAELINSEEYLQIEGPFVHMPTGMLEEMMEVFSERRSLHRKHLHILLQEQIQNLNLSLGIGDAYHGLVFMKQRCKLVCFRASAPQLLEDMLEEVKHVTHLRRHHLHVLLTPLLKNWSSHGIGDIFIAFRLLALRCKNLRQLNISYLRHLNPSVLMGIVPCFTKLVSLNLRMTLTVDQLLGKIGLACPDLLDLNLAGTPVTDKGIVQLCVAEDGRRQCQNLRRLIVTDTAISTAGATVVLQSLPNLREFDYDHIFDVLVLVEQWDKGLESRLLLGTGVRISAEPAVPPSQLSLRTLISAAEYVPIQGLDAATRLCPETRSFTLSNAWLPSAALYKLMMMQHLTSISLTNSEGLSLDFHEGVLPLLTVCGHQLQNLILVNFTSVDITGIGRACPDLCNLAFSSIAEYEPVVQLCDKWFNQLHALELWSDPHADLSPNLIRQLLLFSPNMTNMLFKGCEVLSDKLMACIWEVNPMPKLSHFTLDHCHAITGESLHHILSADNELTVLRIWSCINITKCQHIELLHRIKDENLDVYFEWFGYDG